jgi:hypothetical protein
MAPRRKRPPLAHSVETDAEHHGFHGSPRIFVVVCVGLHPCPSVPSVVKTKAVRTRHSSQPRPAYPF